MLCNRLRDARLVLAITVLSCTSISSAGQSSDNAEIAVIKAMEDERIQAGVRKDVDRIAAATAEDYTQIDLDGHVFDKDAAMRRIRSSQIQLKSNTIDDITVRIFGDSALVTARSTPIGTIDGRDFPQIRYSRVYS
jgi:hypothetical protein